MRQDLFVHTLNNIQGGATALELSEKLNECVEAAIDTGKQAELTLKLVVRPTTRDAFQFDIRDAVTAKIPQKDRPITLMFRDEKGNLSREDPRQANLELRKVDDAKPTEFKQVEEA